MKTTSIATAKANVERENRTFKDHLIAELRHENITDIDDANKYLNEVFIPKMNRRFSYEVDETKSLMKQNNYSEEELNLIISEKTYYLSVDPYNGEIACFMKKTECSVIVNYNAELWCKIENHFYILVELENRDKVKKKEINKVISKDKEKSQKYIPSKNHPWRKFKV